jgi:VIT1/CCC1 family predicted Fe2+/Mn2+ transporter
VHDAIGGWTEEMRSAWLYRVMAEAAPDATLRDLYRRLADEAEEQAGIWARNATADGVPVPAAYRPDSRARVVAGLVRRLGVRPMRPVLAAMKIRGLSALQRLAVGHAMPTRVEEVGGRHGGKGGNLRAAVFGVNDGLVSNASLILGIAGATGQASTIVVSGVAGLLAGAFSMAAGEYVSVRSQREMLEYQLGLERAELERYPREEAAELALIYQARGLGADEARQVADRILSDPAHALETLAREELGLDPADLGSPFGAAAASFSAFATGAALPLLPWLVARGPAALPATIAVTAAALFAVGAAISLFTGRGAARGGLRMLVVGGAAGGVTWALGRLLGVSLG